MFILCFMKRDGYLASIEKVDEVVGPFNSYDEGIQHAREFPKEGTRYFCIKLIDPEERK